MQEFFPFTVDHKNIQEYMQEFFPFRVNHKNIQEHMQEYKSLKSCLPCTNGIKSLK